MLKRLLCLILVLSLSVLSMPMTAFAEENEVEHEISDSSSASTEVSMTIAGDFVVTLPKKVMLDGETKTGTYRVGVKGCITDSSTLSVAPAPEFTLTQGNKPATASVDQPKTQWLGSELDAENYSYADGSITVDNLTAGLWLGNLSFRVKMTKGIEVVATEDATGNSLAAIVTVIDGQDKTDLLQGLVDAGYVADTNSVKGLVSIQTDTFTGTATAVFDVYHIAEPGDVIGIYHYDESAGEWEYVGTAIVSDEGTVIGQFSSFSPVAFAIKEAGLYDADAKLLCSWEDSGIDIETDYTVDNYSTEPAHASYVIANSYPECTEVILPQSVAVVGNSALRGCTSLTSVVIPEGINVISKSTFYGCTSLTSVNIPSSVTNIEVHAFRDCSSLTNVTIPSSVTSIGNSAFYGCSALTSVNIPEGVTVIDAYAFYECVSLVNIVIPEGVIKISGSTFQGCTSLKGVSIPSSVTLIDNFAFSACTSLISITIPEGVTKISQTAFSECTSLKDVSIPSSVTVIDMLAFAECTSLTKVVIPEGVTTLGYNAFEDCTNLSQVSIPRSVAEVRLGAFKGCTSLTGILYNGVTYTTANALKTALEANGVTVGTDFWTN